MEAENKMLLQKNLKNFELIVDCFFSKKHLYYWNFAKNLKKNFGELKKIISQKNTEEFYVNVFGLKLSLTKNKFDELHGVNVLLKNIHYSNILKYLKHEKNKQKFKLIHENFFNCSEDIIYEHFVLKSRIYKEIEDQFSKDKHYENETQVTVITKKNLESFDFIINDFIKKKELDNSNYYPVFKKCVKKLKKNLKNLKNLLKSKEEKENIYLHVQNLMENLVNDKETEYLDDCKYLIKKRHYKNILKYLEMEKFSTKIQKFEEIYEDFLGHIYDIIFDYFYMKKKLERQAEESE